MLKGLLLSLVCLSVPASASAFCGFFVSGADADLYNDASQVVLMRKGTRTVMSMSNNYRGPMEDFAMVIPVPVVLKKEQVKTLPLDVFSKVDQLSAPRLVEYWEKDPCYVSGVLDFAGMRRNIRPARGGMVGSAAPRRGVTIEAQFAVGEYEILILSAKEANGLEQWLRERNYNLPKGAAEALAPYIRSEMKFFVAKVNIKKVKTNSDGEVTLSPLRVDYESPTLRLPVRLGLLNAHGKQDLLIYILHPTSRFEVSNYPNVFIPSNLEVENEVRESFGAFYRSLFDATLEKAGGKAVVTEYAWQTSSCDPCPVPPLRKRDLYTLGGDVLERNPMRPNTDQAGGPQNIRRRNRGRSRRGNFSRWVLTRLHTRYSKETLSEDLIFVAASPIVGGRGQAGRSLEQPGSADPATTNNFQGRYIIRHFWEGKPTCDEPVYGRWGGPPNSKKTKPQVATGLSKVKDSMDLKGAVRSKLELLNLPGKPAPKR